MFKTIIGNKNYCLFYFLGLFLTFGFLQAQETKTIPDVEKVYLHTDNSIYFMGDDLFYKAYNVSAKNNLLTDNSNILYVELISPDAKIIARNKTNLEIGLGHGDFKLVDSLGVKPGVYQLRGYTNYNRNFGEDFVFKKNIEIIDVFEFKSNKKQNITTEIKAKTKPQILPIAVNKQNNLKVDFFPEGGSLLENVTSIVGFKAVDDNGKPIEITGNIYDSDNQLVTSFSSVHDGMGKFQIIPLSGKKYYAKIESLEGIELQENLPEVQKQGYLLSYRQVKGKSIISIMTNEATLLQNPNQKLTVICMAKGVSYLENKQTLNETTSSFELEKNAAPDGISQITLFDINSKPQSERLIYIENEKELNIELSTDKLIYQSNEKAIVNISSKSKDGVVKSGSFSLSVTDRNGIVDEKDFDSNICTYFLMESDIRGKVHQLGYYFNTNNLKRLDHLENLLLTQGWRDFLWKTTPKATDSIYYEAEKGITISGRVKQIFGEKPKANNKLSLTLSNKKQMNFFSAITDVKGIFKFENLMFTGKTQMYLNTRDEQGKFRGEIILDSISQPPMDVSFKQEPINWSESTRTIVENVFKKYTAFGIKPENILNEVEIKSQKQKYATVFYGKPDYSYLIDKKEADKFFNVRDLIEDTVKGTRFTVLPKSSNQDSEEASESSDPTVIIDGDTITEEAELTLVSPIDVIKIEVASGFHVKELYGSSPIISIFTNGKNKGNIPVKDIYQSIKMKIDGFYSARVFYSPTPQQVELDNKLAVRNTLYWNPYVHPDKTGNATVNYYNTKVETKVKVALEGITITGIPVVKSIYYTIKK